MADFSKLVADIESQYEKSSRVCASPRCTLVEYRDCLKAEEKLALGLLRAVLEDIVGSGSADILSDAAAMESKLAGYSVYLGAVELKNSPGSITDAYIKAIPAIDTKLPVSVDTAIDAVVRTLHPYYTRFEKARIVGSRALQISYGAPIMVAFPGSFLDPIDIAEIEFFLNVIPISPVRA